MKESAICNLKVAGIADKHYLYIRGPEAQTICVEIEKRQAIKIINELKIKKISYDSQPASEGLSNS